MVKGGRPSDDEDNKEDLIMTRTWSGRTSKRDVCSGEMTDSIGSRFCLSEQTGQQCYVFYHSNIVEVLM
jgi:hypothetical protein